MVATVIDGGTDNHHGVPEPRNSQMRPSHNRPKHHGAKIDNKVLQRVAINGGNSNRCRPFMMGLVDVFV